MRIAFITPAWQRYELSRVCFAARRWMLDTLLRHGVQGMSVVIADDENLEIAREYGFDTVEHPNVLGAKWNVGYRVAEAWGADYVVPVGSDTWLHPDLFTDLPEPDGVIPAFQAYTLVRRDGRRMVELDLARDRRRRRRPRRFPPVAAWAIPTSLTSSLEPCDPAAMSGCDGSTFRRLEQRHGPLRFDLRGCHPLDAVAFRSEVQITSYETLTGRFHGRLVQDPWPRLAERYPRWLVSMARELHATKAKVAA